MIDDDFRKNFNRNIFETVKTPYFNFPRLDNEEVIAGEDSSFDKKNGFFWKTIGFGILASYISAMIVKKFFLIDGSDIIVIPDLILIVGGLWYFFYSKTLYFHPDAGIEVTNLKMKNCLMLQKFLTKK